MAEPLGDPSAIPPEYLSPEAFFQSAFRALTDHPPFPWQNKLFVRFLDGIYPPTVSLPTGTGKTSIMHVWLIALGYQARTGNGQVTIPRRLAWVVNRRVVVDQATDHAREIARRLQQQPDPALKELAEALSSLSSQQAKDSVYVAPMKILGGSSSPSAKEADEVIAISTLRGEKEDNREWSRDPSRPAIIVGTVDMIGSPLLFSGYGSGPNPRASHAGLLGCDSLIVNDEAHLSPAFARLMQNIEERQRIQNSGLKPFRCISLSATPGQSAQESARWPESLADDTRDEMFRQVVGATKRLHFRPAKNVLETIGKLATEPGPGRTLVFVKSPESARKLVQQIARHADANASARVVMLTGTMRGYERDQMVERAEFKAFAAAERPPQAYWLVATSAGEVGINITAERLITELSTADHLLQRFGRLNRFGGPEGDAYVVLPASEKFEDAERKTLDYLRALPSTGEESFDISPGILFENPPPNAACEKPPLIAPLHDWLIEVLSQTTLPAHPARREVEPWLHGKQESDPPPVYIAWREDVPDLTSDDIAAATRRVVFRKYRIWAHEQLQEPMGRVVRYFSELIDKANPEQRATRLLCKKTNGEVEVISLERFADPKGLERVLANSQLILPPGCGRLLDGLFVAEWRNSNDKETTLPVNPKRTYDIAAGKPQRQDGVTQLERKRACYRAIGSKDDGWDLIRIDLPDEQPDRGPVDDLNPTKLEEFASERGLRLLVVAEHASPEKQGTESGALVYFACKDTKRRTAGGIQYLDPHTAEVSRWAGEFGRSLRLPENVVSALRLAGEWHDLGKNEEIWQIAAGRLPEEPPLAKAHGAFYGRRLRGFRHELGSLARARDKHDGADFASPVHDLALHMVATHHGRARPCFVEKLYDRQNPANYSGFAFDSIRRFARLQRKYGPWGLAYLEAVFKAADAIASNSAEEDPGNE